MVEVAKQESVGQSLSPTDLNLFNYSGKRKEGLQTFCDRLIHFTDIEINNTKVWGAREAELKPKIVSMQGRIGEFSTEALNIRSSISSGMVYLKMLDDFKQRGLTDQQIFDFFKQCLEVNTTLPRQIHKAEPNIGNTQKAMTLAASQDWLSRNVLPIISKVASDVPTWFRGNKDEFYKLMVQYSLFPVFLYPNLTYAQVFNRASEAKAVFLREGRFTGGEDIFGETKPDYMPDWLLDSTTPPTREQVVEELDEDKKTYEQLKEQTSSSFRQGKQLANAFTDKRTRALQWLQAERGSLVTGVSLMPEILLQGALGADREKLIKQFVQDNERLGDTETLALYIEDILKTAGIVKSGNITDVGLDLWLGYLNAYKPEAQDQAKEEFKRVRDVNKRGYNALVFDLAGLFSVLSAEDFDLISEYTEASGNDANSLIFFTADVLADKLRGTDLNKLPTNNPLSRSIGEYKEFTGKFIRKNWDWLYKRLIRSISEPEFEETIETIPESEMDVEADGEIGDEIGEIPAQELREFEQEESRILSDKLSDWEVLYAMNRSSQNRLIEVEGSTGEEREQFLKDFFVKNGISCSIGSKSVVSTLEWKASSPEEIESLIPSKDIDGERWKKTKRGAVRIFYQMNPKNKQMIFFVHQKKAWEYGF